MYIQSWGTILWNYFEIGPVIQKNMSFKDISNLELWQPICSTERAIYAILVGVIMRNNSVKLFLFDHVAQE